MSVGEVSTSLAVLEAAMVTAAKQVLMTDGRRRPGWFMQAKEAIELVINVRNAATRAYNATPTAEAKTELKVARKEVRRAVERARLSWMECIVEQINGRSADGDARPVTPRDAWVAIRALQRGPSTATKLSPLNLRKDQSSGGAPDLCSTPDENAAVMVESLAKTFSQTGTFDPAAVDMVRLRGLRPWMDGAFTANELSAAVRKAQNGKSAGDARCPAEYYKALEADPATKVFLLEVVNSYWRTGGFPGDGAVPDGPPPDLAAPTIALAKANEWTISWQQANPKTPGTACWTRYEGYKSTSTTAAALASGCLNADLVHDWKKGFLRLHDPALEHVRGEPEPLRDDSEGMVYEEWRAARLVLLPKKGDLSLCKNWRGICLLDVASKLLSSMMVRRMQLVIEDEGMDAQVGFRSERGTIDGLFATIMGLQKRKEHNLGTWALFIDLVKAFDTVPREALFAILRRFGLPDHFVNIIIRLHEKAVIKVKIGEVDSDVDSSIGVRQGSCEGPVLFLFIMQAAMETMAWPVAKPEFRTRADGVTSGESTYRKRGASTFEHWTSLFADDCAIFFESRADMLTGTSYLFNHLRKFGLQMHVGSGPTASKTEAMFFPPPRTAYELADTSRFEVLDSSGAPAGFIDFTKEFKYLGSIISTDATSDADVDKRIKSASAAFGALKGVLTNRYLDRKVKGGIYVSLVLSILLYGCEVWSLREDLFNRLRSFHNRCCRTMSRITMAHTIRHHITSKSLFVQLGMESLDTYYNRRILRWAGHVSRMPMSRAPRRLLTGWVAHPRPVGCPNMTWGRTLKKALTSAGLPTEFTKWRDLAAYREQWRTICGSKPRSGAQRQSASSPQAAWAELMNGPPHTAPAVPMPRRSTRERRAPTPTLVLTTTQLWWVNHFGDSAFTKARGEGKTAAEAEQARTKAKENCGNNFALHQL